MRGLVCLALLFAVSGTEANLGKCRTVKSTMLVCHEGTVDDLPKEDMEQVTWLMFVRSEVPIIKKEIMQLYPALTDLHAENNSIETIESDAFHNSKDLNWVMLAENKLSKLDVDLFKNARNLYYLNISSNPNLIIPKNSPFINSAKLSWLDISYSGIEELYPETFKKVRGLKVLSLAGNNLKTLPSTVFAPLHNLYTLDMKNNHFKVLSPYLFKDLSHLSLYLGGNFWDCNCSLYPLIEWSKKTRIKDEVRCTTPNDIPWNEFTGADCPKSMIEVM